MQHGWKMGGMGEAGFQVLMTSQWHNTQWPTATSVSIATELGALLLNPQLRKARGTWKPRKWSNGSKPHSFPACLSCVKTGLNRGLIQPISTHPIMPCSPPPQQAKIERSGLSSFYTFGLRSWKSEYIKDNNNNKTTHTHKITKPHIQHTDLCMFWTYENMNLQKYELIYLSIFYVIFNILQSWKRFYQNWIYLHYAYSDVCIYKANCYSKLLVYLTLYCIYIYYLFILLMCACEHACEGQRIIWGAQFSSSTLWVLGIEPGCDLSASAFPVISILSVTFVCVCIWCKHFDLCLHILSVKTLTVGPVLPLLKLCTLWWKSPPLRQRLAVVTNILLPCKVSSLRLRMRRTGEPWVCQHYS